MIFTLVAAVAAAAAAARAADAWFVAWVEYAYGSKEYIKRSCIKRYGVIL